MNLSREDLLLVNQQLLELYRVRTPKQQTRSILSLTHKLVPSLVSSVTRFNVRNRALEVTTRPWLPVPSRALAKIGELAHESPFPAYFAASGDRGWCKLTDFMPAEEFHQTRLYGKMRCSYIISTMLASIENDQISLSLCRRDSDYSERDRAVLNFVQPHLSLSYNNAEVFERVSRTGRELRAVVEAAPLGYAYVHADGRFGWATAQARELWRQYYPDEATNSNGVPTPVLGWMRTAIPSPTASHPAAATPSLTVAQNGNKLEMRLLPSPLDGYILAVESRPTSARPHFQPLPQLSERENEVLKWMVQGKRNAEIATILELSSRTVEKHVQAILEKFSVENRATAIIRAMELTAAIQSGSQASGSGI